MGKVDASSAFFVWGLVCVGRRVGWLYRDIPEHLRARIEPVVEDHGCGLVDVEIRMEGGLGIVRVTVDTKEGDGRVPIERCAALSRELGLHLDAAEPMPGRYRLEVSSPGLDRILARQKDFEAARGQEVKIQTKRPLDGRRRFRGVLISFEDNRVRIAVDGGETEIAFEEIKKAHTVYQFSRADFTVSGD